MTVERVVYVGAVMRPTAVLLVYAVNMVPDLTFDATLVQQNSDNSSKQSRAPQNCGIVST